MKDETLDNFPTKQRARGDYDKYLDGQVWKITLEPGDRLKTVEAIRSTVQATARRKGHKMVTTKVSKTELVVQVVGPLES